MLNILNAALEKAGSQCGTLMLPDAKDGSLRVAAWSGFSTEAEKELKSLRFSSGQGVAGHVYSSGKPYYVRRAAQEPLYVYGGPATANVEFLCLPIAGPEGRVIAVINIHFPADRFMTFREIDDLGRCVGRAISAPASGKKGIP